MKKLFFLVPIACILAFAQCGSGDDNIYKQGKVLYTRFCANCHQDNGEGLRGLVPPLAKSDYLTPHRNELACMIRKGLKDNIVVNGVTYGTQEMTGLKDFTEFEIANILNYVSTTWGNSEKIWTVEEVRAGLNNCE